ncbi:MAG: hypothetical protein FWG25_02530 [Promicromonosporaceae bacterium]|nr:hypothetical protein [Promicromonosporaceae bacterium]
MTWHGILVPKRTDPPPRCQQVARLIPQIGHLWINSGRLSGSDCAEIRAIDFAWRNEIVTQGLRSAKSEPGEAVPVGRVTRDGGQPFAVVNQIWEPHVAGPT